MTVRITKPEFNLREKISELDKPTGLKGNELMRSDTSQDARDLISAGRKNMIINGAMRINQRNGTSSYTIPHDTNAYGGPDRWAVNEATDGSVSVNMDGDPAGSNGDGYDVQEFTRAFQIACSGTATLSSGHNTHFYQNIEGYNITHLGWGTGSAKPVTLSFWIKTNKAGTYAVGLANNAADRCCIRDYHQMGDSKWNKVVLTFPGCPDGTWLQTNGIGMRVRFCLASGVTYDDGVDGAWVNSNELCTTTSQVVNFMDSTNNRFFITGVQLEVGENATEFENRSFGEELELCQRYFQSNFPTGVAPQNGYYNANSGLAAGFNGAVCFSSNNLRSPWVMFRPKMNHQPDVTLYAASNNDDDGKWAAYDHTGGWSSGSSNSIDYFGDQGFGVRFGSGGISADIGEAYLYRGMWVADAEL